MARFPATLGDWFGAVTRALSGATLALGVSQADADEIQIPGPAGPLFAETITVPGARDVVVIIPGSGPIDRDGNGVSIGIQSDLYRQMAEALAENGIASIRIDKRGFGASTAAVADPRQITVAGYAQDTRDWIARARDIAPCVWVAGHSEGGLVALVAAGTPPDAAAPAPEGLCGLILLATPGRPVGRLLVEQMGAAPGMAPVMEDLRAIVADLEAGRTTPSERVPLPLQAMFAPGLQLYMIDVFAYDPAQVAQGWRGPVLILQGARDFQVRPADADALAGAMPQAVSRPLTDATHMLKADLPGQPFVTYMNPALPLHPELLPAITTFIAANRR